MLNMQSMDDSVSKLTGGALNMSSLMWVGGAILFIVLGLLIYFYVIEPTMKPAYKPNNEGNDNGSNTSNKEAELLLFYVDWCPHCKTAKPAWEEIKAKYENKTINGYTILFTEVNCTNESAEVEQMMNKYKVEGFPTIKLLKDGQVVEYDAKPSKDTLDQFLNSVL